MVPPPQLTLRLVSRPQQWWLSFLLVPGITKDMYEAKLKQYDTELNSIEDKLKSVDETDKDFYVTAEYILQLTKHSSELFRCSEHEERRLLINTVLLNVTWDGVSLCYDYQEPFNLLAEMNESPVWGGCVDKVRTCLMSSPQGNVQGLMAVSSRMGKWQ